MNWLSGTNENKIYHNISPNEQMAPPELLAHAEAFHSNVPSLSLKPVIPSPLKRHATMANAPIANSNFGQAYSNFGQVAHLATEDYMPRKTLHADNDLTSKKEPNLAQQTATSIIQQDLKSIIQELKIIEAKDLASKGRPAKEAITEEAHGSRSIDVRMSKNLFLDALELGEKFGEIPMIEPFFCYFEDILESRETFREF